MFREGKELGFIPEPGKRLSFHLFKKDSPRESLQKRFPAFIGFQVYV